jgi:hypothetical protein
VNIAEFCRNSEISRPSYYKYKREGMPTGDPAATKTWIAKRRASDGRGGKRDRGAVAGGNFLDLKEALLRANITKTEAEARLKSFEAETAQKNLVSMDVARGYVAEVLAPLRTLLDAFPQSAGPRANPADPVLGEQAIREALDGIFRAMEKHRDGGENVG